MLTIHCNNHVEADAAWRHLLALAVPGAGPAGVLYPPAGGAPLAVARDEVGELELQPLR